MWSAVAQGKNQDGGGLVNVLRHVLSFLNLCDYLFLVGNFEDRGRNRDM